jgi:hypothetical protein
VSEPPGNQAADFATLTAASAPPRPPHATERIVAALTQRLYCVPEAAARSQGKDSGVSERQLEASATLLRQIRVRRVWGLSVVGVGLLHACCIAVWHCTGPTTAKQHCQPPPARLPQARPQLLHAARARTHTCRPPIPRSSRHPRASLTCGCSSCTERHPTGCFCLQSEWLVVRQQQ